jgi:ABC-type uncharacterized transport system auxiliary subunit
MNATPRRATIALAAFACLLAGCISVGIGTGESTVQTQYRLEDLAPVPSRADKAIPRALVVTAMPSVGVGDLFSIAYSRAPQQRSLYQYASWADRPSNRVVQLVVRRIDARGLFSSAIELGHGVSGDLMLNITVDELVHDTVAARGRVRLTAELVDRADRSLVARRRFEAEAPVASANAQGAVDALSHALTSVLDELLPWLESAVAARPSAPR